MPRLVHHWIAGAKPFVLMEVGPPWLITISGGFSPAGAAKSALTGGYQKACPAPPSSVGKVKGSPTETSAPARPAGPDTRTVSDAPPNRARWAMAGGAVVSAAT